MQEGLTPDHAATSTLQRSVAERGFVAATTALLMVTLLVAVAFSVDIGNWNVHENKVRAAAEAAALGGSPFLPDDFATAESIARQVAADHGYTGSQVVVTQGASPSELIVTVKDTVPAYFAHIIGIGSRDIQQDFSRRVPAGSAAWAAPRSDSAMTRTARIPAWILVEHHRSADGQGPRRSLQPNLV